MEREKRERERKGVLLHNAACERKRGIFALDLNFFNYTLMACIERYLLSFLHISETED